MGAITMAGLSFQCLFLSPKLQNLSLSSTQFPNSSLNSLTFSTKISQSVFSQVVCEAATQKKAGSAAKRTRQAEVRCLRNKARKSEVKTRMRKALVISASKISSHNRQRIKDVDPLQHNLLIQTKD